MTENKINKIVEELSKFTVIEMNELASTLQKEWNINPMASMATSNVSEGKTQGAEPVKDMKADFDVSLEKIGPRKIEVIKKVKEIYGLGLKEAKDKVDSAPTILKANVNKEDAQDHKKRLEDAGAIVELK